MPLTLEKYAEFLENRKDPAPFGPDPTPFPKVKPHFRPTPGIRAVIWGGYGSLMLVGGGELALLNPDPVMRKISLEKTIHEFKMWQSMSRKPGEPAEYMEHIFRQVHDSMAMAPSAAGPAIVRVERVWEGILGRLFQKEYSYDTNFYGEIGEYCKKIGYYYLRASQGTSAMPDALRVLKELSQRQIKNGVHGDGQCVTPVQLWRQLLTQGPITTLGDVFDPALCVWSHEVGARMDTPISQRALTKALAERGILPSQTLRICSNVDRELAPAKRIGMKSALLLADKASAVVKPEQLKDPKTKPDFLLTELSQVLEIVA